MKKIYLALMCLALFVYKNTVTAQVATSYVFSQPAPVTYSQITGNVAIDIYWDDDNSGMLPIGFTFMFNGVPNTTFNVGSNGNVTFGGSISTTQYNPISAPSANPSGIIAPNGEDLWDPTAAGSAITYLTTGSAPNRVLTIQWKHASSFFENENLNFQVKLYETSNIVEVVYGNYANCVASSCQVGLRGANNTDYNNRKTTNNWAATTAGTTNAASLNRSNSIKPSNGLVFRWTPVPCNGVPNSPVITTPALLTPLCGGASTTITATDNTGNLNGITYQWQMSANNNGPWTDISGQNTLVCTTPALNSTSWFRLKNTCANSGLSDSSVAFQVPVLNIAVQSVNNATRCGPGSVTLGATGNGTIRWWDQPVAGTQLATGNTYTTPSLNATTTYYVDATNGTCTGTRIPVLAVIVPTVSASVSISSNPNTNVCSGTQVLFTASPTNGGVPSYQWQKNGVNVGTNSSNYADYTLANGDVINCIMTTSAACAISPTVTSNSVTASVTPSVFPAVSISSNAGAVICPGTAVTFTAVPDNGGIAPAYQWKKNGFNVGTAPTYNDNNLHDGDIIICTMTSSANCANPGLVGSNPLTISVLNAITPTVSINTTPGAEICYGTNTTFSANAVGSGTNPTYVWKKNGAIVGSNTATYNDNGLNTGDQITLDMTSNADCASPLNASADPVTMIVNLLLTPTISISATPSNFICEGTPVTFSANISNGGNNPSYQWKINGLNMGTNSPSFTSNTLANGNAVTCVLTTSGCAAIPTISSTPVNMAVNVAPLSNITASGPTTLCAGQPLTLSTINIGGAEYQWLQDNTNIPGAVNEMYDITQSGSYQLKVTDQATNCSSISLPIVVTVNPLPEAEISFVGNGTFCQGDSLVLHGPDVSGLIYQWFSGPTLVSTGISNIYAVYNAGDYALVTNDGTCTDTSVAVSIAVNALPDATLTVTGNTLSVSPGQTYQWFFNNQPIPNATSYIYSATQPGNYFVVITNASGCSDTSMMAQITHDVLAVGNISSADNFTLYPNPNSGTFNIIGYIDTKNNEANAEVTDVTGRTVYTTSLKINNGKINQQINLGSSLPAGTYIIRITSNSNKTIIPFQKQ
jgi:hypothetical protein